MRVCEAAGCSRTRDDKSPPRRDTRPTFPARLLFFYSSGISKVRELLPGSFDPAADLEVLLLREASRQAIDDSIRHEISVTRALA